MKNTKTKIIEKTKTTFAIQGYEAVSMRKIASDLDITQSTIYNYFDSKEDLLKQIFESTRKELGFIRSKILVHKSLRGDIKERIKFQFDNATDVIYILKYFFHYRETFPENKRGFVPVEAYRHIEEVLEKWSDDLVICKSDIPNESKIITHAINGFVIEYYPNIPQGEYKENLVNSITDFIVRSVLKPKGVIKNGE